MVKYTPGTATQSLADRRAKINEAYNNLRARIEKLKTEENKSDREIAKDADVRDLYETLFNLEGRFRRNINDYFKNPKEKNKNEEREKEYGEYLEKNPFKRYTMGKKGITEAKVDRAFRGVQVEVKYEKQGDAKPDPKTEETPIEEAGKEGDTKPLADQAEEDKKTEEEEKQAEAEYTPTTETQDKQREGETAGDYAARLNAERQQKEKEQAEKREAERDAQRAQKAREAISNYGEDMKKAISQYESINENDVLQERRDEAQKKLLEDYGTLNPPRLTPREVYNLQQFYLYQAIQAETTQDTVPAAEHEDKPTERPEQEAAPAEDIPEFGDEDKDGDVDRDDYFKKFGGGTRARGKATEEEIAEGVRRGREEEEARKQYEQRQQTIDPQAQADPNVREEQTGTAFTGQQAGIDQEFFYTEPPSTGPRISKEQPAEDLKMSILDKFEANREDAGQIMEDKTRREKTLEQLKQEIRCYHLLYEDKIKSIKDPEHLALYTEALKSDSLKTVREHHKLMSDLIRAYYKVAHLKLGVIMSAESVFGGAVGNIPAMMGSFGMGVPIQRGNEQPTRIDRKKGRDRFSNATAGEINVIRGGRNSKKGIRQAIPRDIDKGKYIDDIPFPNYQVADAFRPRSYMRRRVHTNPEIRIKSGKTQR